MANTYSDYMKQYYTDGISNTSSKANEAWEQLKNSTAQNTQLTQNYNKSINDYLGSIQADKAAVTSRVDDLTGTIKSDKAMLTGKYDTLENYQYNHNPYTSDIGKSILNGFKWQGKNASDNAVADSSASNSGNIDSYAAANASRQQLAFDVAGHNAALNDFNTRTTGIQQTLRDLGSYNLGTYDATNRGIESIVNQNNAGYNASGKAFDNLLSSNLASQAQGSDDFNKYMSLLGFMGDQNQQVFSNDMNYNQQLFDNDQTAQNNNILRLGQESAITGYVPDELLMKNNKYMSLVNNPSVDFAQMIYDKQAELAKATDPTQKQAIQNDIRLLNAARDYKIANVEGYDKYANTMGLFSVPGQLNAETQLARDGFDYQKWSAMYNADAQQKYLETDLSSQEKRNTENNEYGYRTNTDNLASGERMNTQNNEYSYKVNSEKNASSERINSAQVGVDYYNINTNKTLREKEIEAAKNTSAYGLSYSEAKAELDAGRATPAAIQVYEAKNGIGSYEAVYVQTEKEAKAYVDVQEHVSAGAARFLGLLWPEYKSADESVLKGLILKGSESFGFGVEDAKELYKLYPTFSTTWLDNSRNDESGIKEKVMIRGE